MSKHYCISLILGSFLFFHVSGNAQIQIFEKDYTPVQSVGELPNALTQKSSIKYKVDKTNIDSEASKKNRRKQDKFFLESNFVIDNLLRNGKVLYNDPMGIYVNKVADEILKNDPELRKKLSFFVLKTSDINAFATDRGLIFVTAGLLARLENEAQLAFVLCHEIVHFQEKHGFDFVVNIDKVDRKSDNSERFKKKKDNDTYKYKFKKEQEAEADAKGIERFLTSNYDIETAKKAFDILAYAHLASENVLFDNSFLESEYFVFPKRFQAAETAPIAELDDKEDEKSTHPNIVKRKMDAEKAFESENNENRKKFVLPEIEFRSTKEMAHFETLLSNLHDEDYERCLYECFLLSKKYPQNVFLEKIKVKALYYLAKKNTYNSKDVSIQEGSLHGIYFLFDKLNLSDLNHLSAGAAYALYQKFPADAELDFMAHDLMKQLIYEHKVSKDSLTDVMPWMENGKDIRDTICYYNLYSKSCYASYLKDSTFQKRWEIAKKDAASYASFKEKHSTSEQKSAFQKKYKKDHENGLRLGLNKVIVLSPDITTIDARKKNAIRYEKAEAQQIEFNRMIKDASRTIGLETEILDQKSLKTGDVETYNDIASLTDWLQNQNNFEDLSITPGVEQAKIDKIIKKYGTKHLVLTDQISMRTTGVSQTIIMAAYPPFLPTTLLQIFLGREFSLFYTVVYNLETGGYTIVKVTDTSGASLGALKHQLYDALLQIKSK